MSQRIEHLTSNQWMSVKHELATPLKFPLFHLAKKRDRIHFSLLFGSRKVIERD